MSALAYYFGWVLTNSRASYFGIDASALDFSTQDYLLRSADALFVPLGRRGRYRAGCGLAARLRQHPALRDNWPRARARCGPGGGGCRRGAVRNRHSRCVQTAVVLAALPLPSASPGIGIALLAYGLHLFASTQPQVRAQPGGARNRGAAITLVALLIVLSSFWTASKYADALGAGAASASLRRSHRARRSPSAPKRLNLQADGTAEQRLAGEDLAYRYAGWQQCGSARRSDGSPTRKRTQSRTLRPPRNAAAHEHGDDARGHITPPNRTDSPRSRGL